MKIKLTNEYNPCIDSPLHFVLKNRGIKEEDIEKVIEPTAELMPDWRNLDHIETGLKLLNKHIEAKSSIGIVTDCDFDGLTSVSAMYKYLKDNVGYDKALLTTIQHERNKAHGIPVKEVRGLEKPINLLIVPDSGSSDFEEMEVLSGLGIDILVIDHHLAPKKKDACAVIINNQLSDNFPNKSLTGASMIYLFCKAYSEAYNVKAPDNIMDLAASGMIADRADFSKDLGAYYIMREGLKRNNIHSEMLKHIIEKNSNLSAHRDLTAKDIGFNVAPLFNSVFRMGKPEELEQVVHGMCEYDYTLYNSRKKIEQSIIKEGLLRAEAVKRRQKKQEDEVMSKIMERIEEKGSADNKVLIVNSTNIVSDAGLNGLIAMKLVREYKRPVLMVKIVGDKLKGSARNVNNSPIESLNKLLSSTGIFECAGHDNAFGVSFKMSDALLVNDILNELLKDIKFDSSEYEVDFQWEGNTDNQVIHEIASNSHIWCNGLDEPLIHLKDIKIKKSNIQFIGKSGSTMKVMIDGVSCIKFRMTESELYEISTASEFIKMDLICKASINTFNGLDMPQLLIEDYSIEDYEHISEPSNMLDDSDLPF